MPATIATIIAVSTDAMILFHSKDDIAALRLCRAVALQPADCAGPAENRIPAGNSTELSRFRRADEPGILSLPLPSKRSDLSRVCRPAKPDRHDPGPARGGAV